MSNKPADNNNDSFIIHPDVQEILNAVRKSINESREAGITGLAQIEKTVKVHGEVTRRTADRKKVLDKK